MYFFWESNFKHIFEMYFFKVYFLRKLWKNEEKKIVKNINFFFFFENIKHWKSNSTNSKINFSKKLKKRKENRQKWKKSILGKTGCLSNLYYLLAAQSSKFLIHPFPQNNHLVHLSYLTNHCAVLAWYMGCFAMLTPYLGKQRISLGVATMLRMCLYVSPQTFFTCNQFNQKFWSNI